MNFKHRHYVIAFFGIVTILIFFNLGGWGLSETSEARYAEIGREMLLSGDYLNPQFLGIYHYHKPPLTYYITTFGYRLFGINEVGARFFLQIGVLLQLILVYKLTELLFQNKKWALLSSIIYFTIPLMVIASRNLTTDIYLTTFIMAGIYHWLCYVRQKKGVWNLYLYFLFMGIAMETKGPVALLFMCTFAITYRIIFKEKFRLTIHQVLGFLMFAVIGSAWYVLVIMAKPELINYFVFKQTVSRVTSQSFHRDQPFWFYLPILIGLLFPYIIGLIPGVKKLFLKTKEDRLVILNIGIVIVLFSLFSTKRIFYLLPVFWLVAIWVVRTLQYATHKQLKAIRISFIVLVSIMAAAYWVLYFIPVSDIRVTIPVLVLVTIPLLLILFIYFKYFHSYGHKAVYFLAFGFMCMLLGSASFFMGANKDVINSFKPVVAFINNESDVADKKIMVFDYMVSSIPFYTNDDFYILNYLHDTVVRDVQFQDDNSWKEHHVNIYMASEAQRLETLLSSGKNYILVLKKNGIAPPFKFIEEKLPHQKDFGKWILYYN